MRRALVLFLLTAGCGGLNYPDTFHPPWPAPDVKLKTGAEEYSLAEDRKNNHLAVTLVFFGFTHCPDICPFTLKRIGDTMSELTPEERAKLRVLFVSIDPERDNPDLAREYARKFHTEIIGLSGTPEEVARAAKDYRVFSEKKEGKITHASGVYWINREGGISKILPGEFKQNRLLSDLRITLNQP